MTIFPEIEEQIRRSGGAHGSQPSRPPRPQGRWRGLPAVASAVVVIGVVAIIVAFSAGHHPSKTATTSPKADLRLERQFVDAAGHKVEGLDVCHAAPATASGAPSSAFLSILGSIRPAGAPLSLPTEVARDFHGVYTTHTRLALRHGSSRYWIIPVAETGSAEQSASAGCRAAAVTALHATLTQIPARLRTATLDLQQQQFRITRRISGPAICLAVEHPVTLADSCAQSADALNRRGLLLTEGELSGIVPDGVSQVTIRYQSRAHHRHTRTAHVINNVFATNIDLPSPGLQRTATITWHNAQGTQIKTISGLHSASTQGGCAGRYNPHVHHRHITSLRRACS
jgi:hypothetical protein